MLVTHHPRLAWDGAMAFVGATVYGDLYGWLTESLGDLLGPEAVQALAVTHNRLRRPDRPDAAQVESGRWRARLADVLDRDPALAASLGALVRDTRARLREVQPPLALTG